DIAKPIPSASDTDSKTATGLAIESQSAQIPIADNQTSPLSEIPVATLKPERTKMASAEATTSPTPAMPSEVESKSTTETEKPPEVPLPEQKQLDQSIKISEVLPSSEMSIKKTNDPEALKWAEKSYESVSLENFTNAIDEATMAISLDPGLVMSYINRAWAYIEIGQYDKAIADCHTAIKLDPDNAIAVNNLGLAYHRMGKLQMAEEHYKQACDMELEIACTNYNIFVIRLSVLNIIQESQEALRQKKWDTVLQLTSDIFQLDTNNETARMMRTEAIKQKEHHQQALKWAEKSYESVAQGNFTNAIDEATISISFDPGLANSYINRAWAYIEIGQYDKAIADCHTAIKLDPYNALAVNNLGLAYHRMGKLQMAEKYYKQACDMELEVACTNYNIFVTRLSVLNIIQESQEALRQKKWDTVLQLTSDIFQLDTNNETARMMRTEAIKQKEHHQQALKWAEKSYESVAQGNFTDAIDEATISISFDPELANSYINRAWAYIEIGQHDKAITDCHTAIKLDPYNALAINNLGLAYHRMGKLQMARKHYKKACDLNMNIACENYKSLSSSE
ncbi:MAG: tetratricopeptide repeat protein, partial [Desulfobacterales bacterium]|nr:tetratricopeptide repeat protein [Desulfobacterales bacterium]